MAHQTRAGAHHHHTPGHHHTPPGHERHHPESHHHKVMEQINREHHARNADTGGGMRAHAHETATVGGSMKFSDPGPKGPGLGIPKGNADVKSLGKASAGRIDPASTGKNVA